MKIIILTHQRNLLKLKSLILAISILQKDKICIYRQALATYFESVVTSHE